MWDTQPATVHAPDSPAGASPVASLTLVGKRMKPAASLRDYAAFRVPHLHSENVPARNTNLNAGAAGT